MAEQEFEEVTIIFPAPLTMEEFFSDEDRQRFREFWAALEGEREVWVMNRRRHTVHELDCWKLHKMWANPELDLSESDYDKMRAADVPLEYHRCRHCAPGVA
jgi:hypothetical protein